MFESKLRASQVYVAELETRRAELEDQQADMAIDAKVGGLREKNIRTENMSQKENRSTSQRVFEASLCIWIYLGFLALKKLFERIRFPGLKTRA